MCTTNGDQRLKNVFFRYTYMYVYAHRDLFFSPLLFMWCVERVRDGTNQLHGQSSCTVCPDFVKINNF